MAKVTKQPVLNIGLVGHIDHGKTTLLYQLTGIWADKHSEELKRGITIKLGYADVVIRKCGKCGKYGRKEKCECGNITEEIKYVSFVDAPGHEMLMATMLSGAAIIDAAILVVAANEGIKPQTREHLAALGTRGIKQIIVAQNKIDLVSKEEAIKNYEDIKKFISMANIEAQIIPVCAQQNVNIDALFEAIDKIKIPERDIKAIPIFLVARSFDVNLPGSDVAQLKGGVLGGVLKQGMLKIGDEIEIKPGITIEKYGVKGYKTIFTKIIAMRSGKNDLSIAEPSGSLAIQTELDPFMTKADNLAGNVIGLAGQLPEIQSKIRLKTRLLEEVTGIEEKQKVEPLRMNEFLLFSINTSITVGSITKIEKDEIEVLLKIPVIVFPGSKVGIARNMKGHWRLIGWGEIL